MKPNHEMCSRCKTEFDVDTDTFAHGERLKLLHRIRDLPVCHPCWDKQWETEDGNDE